MQNTEAQNTQNTRRGIVVTETTTAPALESHFRALLGDTTQQAREAFGEDSVTRVTSRTTYTATNVMTGEVIGSATIEGTTETSIGAAYEASHPQAIPQNARDVLLGACLGALRAPVMAQVDAVMTAMTDGSMTLQEGTEALMTALNVTPEAHAAGVEALRARRALSVRTRRAQVRTRTV